MSATTPPVRHSPRLLVPSSLGLLLVSLGGELGAAPMRARPARLAPAAPGVPDQDDPPAPAAANPQQAPVPVPPADVDLGDSVITATRVPEREIEIPRAVNIIDAAKISERAPQTTPDALEGEVGVVVQKTNQGGGSPVVRGRTGKEVLYLIDGIRFNNSTFRRNTQYLNTIDIAAVERIEVVRGPASVLYGSDAMGGAINVRTRRFDFTRGPHVGGRLFTSFESANRGALFHLSLEGGTDDFGVIAGATYKDFDDLRAGNHGDPVGAIDRHGRQVPTGYTETDFSVTGIWRLDEHSSLDVMVLHSRQDDVPRSDRLIPNDEQPTAPDLQHHFDPQILRWYQARYRYENLGEFVEGFELSAVLQNPEETRRRIRTSQPTRQTLEYDEIRVPGLTAQWNLRPVDDHLVTTGLEGYYESVDSRRVDVDLTSGVQTPNPSGRYPDGAVYQSYGAYLQDEWRIDDDWLWTSGVRYSQFRLRADFAGLTVGPVGPIGREDETYRDVTFATGLSHRVTDESWVYGSISRGFRAPNLDDVAVLGDFAAGDRVPNLDLDPEHVWAFEVGTKHLGPTFRGGTAGAVAFYEDLLDTEVAFNDGTQDYFHVANRGRAIIYSLELWAEQVICRANGDGPEHVVFGNAFGNWGRNTSEDEPVSKVPPPQAELGYRMQSPERTWFAEAFVRGALEQDRLSAADEADPRIPNDGTPGWWTFNLRTGASLTENLDARLGLENLFDQRYRVHGSGIDAPGFNVTLALDYRF